METIEIFKEMRESIERVFELASPEPQDEDENGALTWDVYSNLICELGVHKDIILGNLDKIELHLLNNLRNKLNREISSLKKASLEIA